MTFKRLIKRFTGGNNYVDPKINREMVYSFTSGGIEYFELADFDNIPPLRGLKTIVFYEEMRMKCTVDYLEKHTEAIDNILKSQKIDIFELKKLNDQLKQRLKMAVDLEIALKIASINFVTKEENIEDYDFQYNAKKIAHWKKHDGSGFFLRKPIKKLIPILENMPENIETYFQINQQLNQIHSENLSLNLQKQKITS